MTLARNLDPFTWLADGALIVRLSVTTRWVYARVVKDGHARTRRYRPDADVKTQAAAPAPS